jgi:hypothetical protein
MYVYEQLPILSRVRKFKPYCCVQISSAVHMASCPLVARSPFNMMIEVRA